MSAIRADLRTLAFALTALAALTALDVLLLRAANAATVAISFLLIVLLAAGRARFWVAGLVSVAATLVFNFFFIPPVGTWTVADPQNWIALFAFLGVSLVVSSLSATARAKAALATERARGVEERKSAEVARQGEALKSALLASLAHDLKTPLTAVKVAAGNLRAEWLTEEQRREQADIVLSEVSRLTQLFEHILDMARIEAGAVPISREWVPVGEILEAARAQAGPALREHVVEIEDSPPDLVQVDPRLTSAALAHLLNNAARYSPRGSRITISAGLTGEGLRLSVRDRGPGIPPVDLPHVFDRFYRGAAAANTAGTGMGLAIARGLLAAERGRLWAENCPDGGARFTMIIPAETRTAMAQLS